MSKKFQRFSERFTLAVLTTIFFLIAIEVFWGFSSYLMKELKDALRERGILREIPYFQDTIRACDSRLFQTGTSYNNPYFGVRLAPNSQYGEFNLKVKKLPDEFSSKYRVEDLIMKTNKWGFIKVDDIEIDPFKTYADKLKIVCFGGSTMAGWGAAMKEGIPFYLKTMLKEKGLNSVVINAGVFGYYSLTEFLYYSMEIVNFKPDVVIFLDGYNDAYGNNDYLPSLKAFFEKKGKWRTTFYLSKFFP